MKKFKYLSLALVLFVGVLTLAGCTNGGDNGGKEKEKTSKISYNYSTYNITLEVPQDEEGNAKYEFTTTKPTGFSRSGAVYLELDKSILAFGSTSWTYQTAVKYKEKYGTKDPSYTDYIEWMNDSTSGIKLGGVENVKTDDGREGIKYYAREGGSGDYKYYGYNYMFSLDDINPKMRLEVVAYYKGLDELPKEAKELDEETLKVIKSLKLEVNKK